MGLNLQQKKTIVTNMHKMANLALSAIIADSRGIIANKINYLRKKSRKNGVIINVVRNNLLKLAFKNTQFECLKKKLSGPIIIAYSMEHPGSAARIFKNFSLKNKKFKIIGAALNSQSLSSSKIDLLAAMPTYKESIIQIITIMKEITLGKLLRILIAIKNK
ncbi:50S ribosomal protein L10 [Buchnera aphidicola (Mindarus keteleerifoliae)]|uniref:50S ribosomal protein L10 n=1 Tax=Buchnera aphidicola TaxID=9 RepID=UPI0031B69052